ncbi:hypothetical protein E4U59_006659, partial [Claviceps monticola]
EPEMPGNAISEVRVFGEEGGWHGPYKFIAVDSLRMRRAPPSSDLRLSNRMPDLFGA